MGSQEGIESTEDAAIANEQPIARKTKVDPLQNGDIKVDASFDDAITSPIEKHDINGSILDEQIGAVVPKDPIMLEEVVRDAELGSNTSEKEIKIFEDKDPNEGMVEDFGKHGTDRDRVGSVIVEGSSVQEGLDEEKPHKSSFLVEDKLDGLDSSGVEEETGLNEENLLQEFSLRADEDVKNNDSAGELTMDKGDEPTITSIDQDEDSSEQVMEVESDVQELPILVEDEIQRKPIAQELALPGQDEAPHVENVLTTLDEKSTGGAVDNCVVDESTEHLQGVHEAPLAPADGIEESTNVIDESNVCETPSTVVKEEVTSASTESEGIPKEEVAAHVEVENDSNEVSDALPTQGEIVEEAPTTALVTDVADVSPTPVAQKGEDCEIDESTGYTKGVDASSIKEWESKGVVDVTPTLETDVDEALPCEEPALVASNDNSSSLPMQDEVVEAAALINNVKDVSPTPVEEEPTVGGEEAVKVEDCDVESTKNVQGADETPTSPVEVEESTHVVDESNGLETPPKEEVIPASTQFEGEPELAKSIDVEVASVESTEASVPLEEHADDVKNNSHQLSDSLRTEEEIVEEVPTGDVVTTAEDVSSTPVDEEPIGGREAEFGALKADDSTKPIERVEEEPVEVHESKEVADESNAVKDEVTAAELTEVNTEDDVTSREALIPLEEPTHVVENDSNEDLSPTPVEEEPIAGGEEENVASKVEGCDDESTKDVQGADETPTSPVVVEESTHVVETPPIVVKEEVIPASSQFEGEPELVDVEVSTEDSVESTEAPVPLEEHADDVKNNSSQVSDSLPTQDEVVEEVPTGPIVATAEDVSSTPVDEEPIGGREEEFGALKADDCAVDESTKHIERVEEEPVEEHESKDVADESTVVKDELTAAELTDVNTDDGLVEGNTEDGLVEGNTEDDVKSREAPLPLEEPVKTDSNEVLGTLPGQVEEDATIPLVEDVIQEAEPVAGGEKEPPALHEIDESTKLTGGGDEAEEPKDMVHESTMGAAEVAPTLEDDVGSREATLPTQVAQNNGNEDSHSLPAHDEIVEEVPTFTSVEDVSSPAQEEEATVGREEKSVKVEDSEVEESAQGVETPVEVEESTEVVDGLDVVDEKVIPASNQGEPDVEFREAGEEESTALSVEDCTVITHAGVDEAPLATTEIDESKEVVDESNANETPLVEEESKEVVDESNAKETPVIEESEEVVDESNATETPTVETKEVVDESNAIEAPSTVAEEEVSPASTPFEEEPEVAEVAQDHMESRGEGEVKEDVASTEEEAPVCGGEEESVASSIRDFEVDESTKHGQGVPAATGVQESKAVVDELNVLETPSTVAEEEVTPTSTESKGGPAEVAKSVEVTTEPLALEERTQDSSNEDLALAAEDEIVEEAPTTLITNAEDVEEEPVVGGEEEPLALKVEDSNADESTKHTAEGVETLPTSNEVDESKGVVDELETSSTVVEEATATPVEVEPVDGGEEESPELKVENGDESTKHTERVDETPTEVEAGDEVPLAPSDEAPLTPLAPAAASVQDAPPTLVEEELIDHVGGGEEQVADGDNDVDEQVENAQEVDEESKNVDLVDAPSATVEDEVTPTSSEHEREPLAAEVEVKKQDDVESREMPMEVSVGNNIIEEPSALSGQGGVVEEAQEKLADNVVGGEEEAMAATEADEAPSAPAELEKLDAPSTTVGDEVTRTSHKEPVAPESIDSEAEDVMEDATESLEEEPAQVIEKSSSDQEPRHEEVVEEAPAADAPLASVKDISPTQVEQNSVAGERKAQDDLPRELNVQVESVEDGVGSSSEFEAEPQKATSNGVPQHEDVGDLSEEETEPKEASMNGWSTNGGLVASTLRTIVTTTMNLVKTTKPSKKKRMKLKKMQQV